MKKILLVGAGRTATTLVSHLKELAEKKDWEITIADQLLELAKQKADNHPKVNAIRFDVFNNEQRKTEVSKANVIVSLLPESLHIHLVNDCIKHKVHLLTASYVSPKMKAFHEEAQKRGIILLNEMGLDPGIDHMETMRIINKVKQKGGKITSLRSFGGGLVSPQCDDNPWGYKITWNPMNVVTAGMPSAKYVKDGKLKIVPYNRLFLNTGIVNIPSLGKYEAYPNRDSLKYLEIYNVPELKNVYRGSLRKIGYCSAWNALIKIGLTDNRYNIPDSHTLTYNDFVSIYLSKRTGRTTGEALLELLDESPDSPVMKKIEWLGLLSNKKIKVKNGSPAEILLDLLLEKWEFQKDDKDMVILHTEVEYEFEGKTEKIVSSIIVYGKDSMNTAMSATVGLPLAIGTNLVLDEKIKERGVIIPIYEDIYNPALAKLAELGIKPTEQILTKANA
jgi:saccharopine dehydrogenase (NADP+, L-glutamate forming)